VEVKVVPLHAMKACKGSKRYSSTHFSPYRYMEVIGQHQAPAALLPEKKLWYPLNGRLGGPQSQYGKKKNTLPLPGIRTPQHRSRSLISMDFTIQASYNLSQ